jgi:hypothetical protein
VALQQIVESFAPQVRISSRDLWNPVSVEWFLARSELRFQTDTPRFWKKTISSQQILEYPTQETLISQNLTHKNKTHQTYGAASSHRDGRWYLKLKTPEFYTGMSSDEIESGKAPVYVHILHRNDHTIDLQYFFFYAYNGNVIDKLSTAGAHEGDWEHITVRLSDQVLQPTWEITTDHEYLIGIFYARHGKEGRWYMDEKLDGSSIDNGYRLLENSNHPIVYSAKGGHASYTHPQAPQKRYVPFGVRLRFLDDHTDDSGQWWDTWKNCVILDPALPELKWMHFVGQWGNKASTWLDVDGPYGPLMKHYYQPGDSEPSPLNRVTNTSIPSSWIPFMHLWIGIVATFLLLVVSFFLFVIVLYRFG